SCHLLQLTSFPTRRSSDLEVYVEQPPGFEDERYPDHVCKLSKALYGLKQAPRAWYECLRDFLLANAFKVGKADPTLFTKTCDGEDRKSTRLNSSHVSISYA